MRGAIAGRRLCCVPEPVCGKVGGSRRQDQRRRLYSDPTLGSESYGRRTCACGLSGQRGATLSWPEVVLIQKVRPNEARVATPVMPPQGTEANLRLQVQA